MKKYFYLDESPLYSGKYMIRVNIDEMPFNSRIYGSLNVLPARVLNLPYHDYLRYVRDRVGAELIGKGHLYVVPYFEKNLVTNELLKLLNKRMEYLLIEQEHPYDIEQLENGGIKRIFFSDKDKNEG